MSDRPLILELLSQIRIAAQRVARRFEAVNFASDFTSSEEGVTKLDSICLQLAVIGETLKKLDQVTEKRLLVNYPQVDWKSAMGMRDIISHHYADLDAEAVFDVCQRDIPVLIETLDRIITDMTYE